MADYVLRKRWEELEKTRKFHPKNGHPFKRIHLMNKRTIALLGSALLYLAACGGAQKSEETNTETPASPAEIAESKPVSHPGKAVYMSYCMTCHQKNGEGVPGLNPPLAGTEWVTGDKTRLIGIVLNGLQEEIEVNGEKYNNVMASHAFLSDKQIADVLSYIRQDFGNDAAEVTEAEVAAVRAAN